MTKGPPWQATPSKKLAPARRGGLDARGGTTPVASNADSVRITEAGFKPLDQQERGSLAHILRASVT